MSLRFYQADANYCDFLRKSDPCVPHVQDDKNARPFVGVLLSIGNINYFAPLSSPKPKHATMKNQVDFLKINNGVWGAINFNNMIPIHASCLKEINMKIDPNDIKSEVDYKNLLANQLSWCNSNRATILSRAEKLYRIIVDGKGWSGLAQRCCDFEKGEDRYREYCSKHGL